MEQNNPLSLGIAGVFMATPAGITAQEYRGQQELKNAKQLPNCPETTTKDCLERWGIKFLGPVKGDKLFQHVILPEGWMIKPTDHSMWSDLLDDKGYKRASIFYKASFHDRDASISIETRLRAGYECVDWDEPHGERMFYPVIMTSNRVALWCGKPIKDSLDATDECRKEAGKIIESVFPLHESGFHYWDCSDEELKKKLPKSKDLTPKGDEYKLHVSLYHSNGEFADSGHQKTKKFTNEKKAIKRLTEIAEKSFKGRYRVVGTITQGDKTIHQFEIPLPQPKIKFRRFGCDGSFLDCKDGYYRY